MRKIVNIIFILILVLFSVFVIIKISKVKEANAPVEVEEPTSNKEVETKTLEDGSVVTTETYIDGTVVETTVGADGELISTEMHDTTPEPDMNIPEKVCPVKYTVADNEFYIVVNASTEKTDKSSPSSEVNKASGCQYNIDAAMQIENGYYENSQIRANIGAFFFLIDENDVVNITVNDTTYTLDANNPTLELQLKIGDNVTIDSTNEAGVYYRTQNQVNMYEAEQYSEYEAEQAKEAQ